MRHAGDVKQRVARATRATIQTVFVSTLLAIVKIAAGWIGHSYALIADGIESLLDIVSSLVVWGGLRIAVQPPDRNHPYGHGKAESLAAIVVALVLLAAAAGLAVQSVREILTKELIYRRLATIGRITASTAVATDAWHHRADALTSATAFVGISVALLGGEGFETADDWAALVACGIIGWNGLRLLRSSIDEVMDVAAPEALHREIRSVAGSVPGVVAIEKCIARKSGPGWLVDIHVEVDGRLPVEQGHAIGHQVKEVLCSSGLRLLDVLVHIEPAVTPAPAEPA
jgi:divalent metal cation (Fe/Co/Zn/Cd) transporter